MNKKLRPFAAGILAVALAATMGITVFAAGTDSTMTAEPQLRYGNRPELTDELKAQMKADMDSRMKTKLDELVAAGTITREQADAAYAIIAAGTRRIDFDALPAEVAAALKDAVGKGHGYLFGDLTADQRAAVKTVMDESMNSALTSLVSAGTITQEQADAISARDHDRATMETLTAEQRGAVRAAIEAARANGLATLVNNGTLTQDQADRMPKGGREGRGGHVRPNDNDADDAVPAT